MPDSAALQSLLILANKCPFEDGVAVYNARAFLYQFGYSIITNNCEGLPQIVPPTQKRLRNPNDAEITLYPNPSSGLVYIYYNSDKLITIELFDVSGRLVFDRKLNPSQKQELKIEGLKHGVYLYRIYDGEIILKNGKLVIQD